MMIRELKAIILCVCLLGCSGNESSSDGKREIDPPDAYFAQTFDMFLKATDAQWEALPYERLSLRRDGCFGTCPVYEVQLFRGGKALYEGVEFAPRKGAFTGKVRIYGYGLLCSLAERLSLDDLESLYAADWTDDETVTIELVCNGETKTISDYGRQAPPEFQAFRALFDELVEQIEWEPSAEGR